MEIDGGLRQPETGHAEATARRQVGARVERRRSTTGEELQRLTQVGLSGVVPAKKQVDPPRFEHHVDEGLEVVDAKLVQHPIAPPVVRAARAAIRAHAAQYTPARTRSSWLSRMAAMAVPPASRGGRRRIVPGTPHSAAGCRTERHGVRSRIRRQSAPHGAGRSWMSPVTSATSDSRSGTGQQLLDVPGVLRAAGEQLEQHEVAGQRRRQPRAAGRGRLRAVEQALLPAIAADDEIDRTFTGLMETDHPGERVVGIAARYRHVHAGIREPLPARSVDAVGRQRQQVDVASGAGDAVDGHRRGADHGVPRTRLIEDGGDAFDQAHPRSRSRHAQGRRVACLRRSRSRMAVGRSRSWVARKDSRSSSPRRNARARRSSGVMCRTSAASRARRVEAAEFTKRV